MPYKMCPNCESKVGHAPIYRCNRCQKLFCPNCNDSIGCPFCDRCDYDEISYIEYIPDSSVVISPEELKRLEKESQEMYKKYKKKSLEESYTWLIGSVILFICGIGAFNSNHESLGMLVMIVGVPAIILSIIFVWSEYVEK